ncbi:Glycine receptor subunit beta-type 4 [Folsomia candida]|uniref:Glycine receptor subunit beta-type 4 n=1 Tax=Folsomia candida TaxID=158441 RepID=A0A226DEL4_FOLCA|nr:Glycine receptor subunit beta-type 4 [Folsomia candida]
MLRSCCCLLSDNQETLNWSERPISKTVEELILEWKLENPITTGSLQMTQFAMVDIIAAKCHEAFQIGNYSCLVAEFHLARLLGFHLVQSYLPTILMVVISWVSFWMDVNSVPGRVTLGITTLLTVSSKATNVQENIESSYVKAIDVWMGACTAFVFLALMEFTVVNYLWRKEYQMHGQRGAGGGATSGSSRAAVMLSHSIGGDPNSGRCDGHDSPKGQATAVSESGCGDGSSLPTPPGNVKTSSPTTGVGGENAIGGNSWELKYVDNPNHHQYHTTKAKDKCKFYNYDKQKSSTTSLSVDGLKRNRNYQELAKSIDECCRVMFPLAFSIFVISYWILYLYL